MNDILLKPASLVVGLMLFSPACTDLEEELYSDITSENFFQSEEEFISAMGQAYTSLSFLGSHGSLWTSNELASDQLVVTTKGGDWYSGGELPSLHAQTYSPDNPIIHNAWNAIYSGINTCNRLIFQMQTLVETGNVEAVAYVAEIRALRAMYYYWALDAFGNVPLYIDFTDENPPTNASDFQTGRTAIYDFVETELNSVIHLLDPTIGGKAYGRIQQMDN